MSSVNGRVSPFRAFTTTTFAMSRAATWLAPPLVVLTNAFLLWYFHNRFWFPTDDGNYAHMAQRMLAGEILNLQVQDIHAGYINFVNAAAMRLFGLDLLSMRYPLALVSFLQSGLIFLLFRKRSTLLAVTASIAATALGVIQFLNPTANWYCLFVLVLIICCLQWVPREYRYRVYIVGFLLVTVALFRQLTGVIVAIAVLTYLLIESGGGAPGRQVLLERALVSIMAGGLFVYLLKATDAFGFLAFGAFPLGILAWLWVNSSTPNRDVLKIISQLCVGGAIAAMPLLVYHISHQSISLWFHDVVVTALVPIGREYVKEPLFGSLVLNSFLQILNPGSFRRLLSGFYWFFLPLLALVNGLLVFAQLTRRKLNPGGDPLPILAVFYAVVSVHYQIPAYLYYSVGLSLTSLMWFAASTTRWLKPCLVALAILLSLVGIIFHAAQPQYPRSVARSDILAGIRGVPTFSDLLPGRVISSQMLDRCSLEIEASDRARYAELVRFIQKESSPDEKIFVLPSNAELYFLADRANPFRFFDSAMGVKNSRELEEVLGLLVNRSPKLVVYDPVAKHNTSNSVEIMKLVRERYEFLGTVAGLEMYRARGLVNTDYGSK